MDPGRGRVGREGRQGRRRERRGCCVCLDQAGPGTPPPRAPKPRPRGHRDHTGAGRGGDTEPRHRPHGQAQSQPKHFPGVPSNEVSPSFPARPPTQTRSPGSLLRPCAPPGGTWLPRHEARFPDSTPPSRLQRPRSLDIESCFTHVFMFSFHIPVGLNKFQHPCLPLLSEFSIQGFPHVATALLGPPRCPSV